MTCSTTLTTPWPTPVRSAISWRSALALIARLKRIRSRDRVAAITRAWVEVSLQHTMLLDLLPELMTSMENNSSVEQVVEFKKTSYQQVDQLVQVLEQVEPALSAEAWASVVQLAVAMMAGLWPMTNPGENVVEAHNHPEVQRPVWNFEELMARGLSALIQGHLTNTKG